MAPYAPSALPGLSIRLNYSSGALMAVQRPASFPGTRAVRGSPRSAAVATGRGPRAVRAVAAIEAPPVTATPAPPAPASTRPQSPRLIVQGVHHVALICADLEASLQFYCNVLGLEVNPDRPHSKLPYRGAWLWIGPEMIHLMELPNPDPADASKRPKHGGRDRHFCIGVASLGPLEEKLRASGVEFTRSASGRAAVFFRDPDANVIECVEGAAPWR